MEAETAAGPVPRAWRLGPIDLCGVKLGQVWGTSGTSMLGSALSMRAARFADLP
jgi:hypothetical protein